jgi:hypothetical protein
VGKKFDVIQMFKVDSSSKIFGRGRSMGLFFYYPGIIHPGIIHPSIIHPSIIQARWLVKVNLGLKSNI